MAVKKIGVLGAGQMGGGIALVAGQAGYQTVVREINDDLLAKGLARVRATLEGGVKKGKLTEAQMTETMGRIRGTTRLDDLSECDLIVEAIIENVEEKRKVFAVLDNLCPAHTILTSNTSSLAIIEMAAATKRMDRVAGCHFFNPVHQMALVEVSRTIATSDETIDTVRRWAESLGKIVVMTRDTPGFIVNRLIVPYLLDAIVALEENVGSMEDIDKGMVLGLGHPMGPFTLMDLIGLDTIYYIANVMFDEYKVSRFAPPPLLRRMVLAGQLGRKSGKGFYDYTNK